jgi:tetratricopeptide (TPR) repeat protein
MEVIRRADFPQKILNIAHDGGYIAVHAPGRKVFCDTRTSLYGLDFLRTLNQALLGQPKAWNSIMEKWSPHAVAVNTCWPEAGDLTARMIASRNWKLIYFDGSTALLVRNLPEYASLLSDRQIQSSGLALLEKARQEYSRQGKLFKQGTSSRLIGAGTVYLSLNRAQQAGELFALLARHNPRMAGAWLGLGRSLVFQRQLSNGLAHMEHAARITPNSGQVWIRLFEIYRLKGDEAKMREASDQLTKFYKAETATVEQQAVKEDKKAEEKPTEKSKGSEPSGFELPDDLKK